MKERLIDIIYRARTEGPSDDAEVVDAILQVLEIPNDAMVKAGHAKMIQRYEGLISSDRVFGLAFEAAIRAARAE